MNSLVSVIAPCALLAGLLLGQPGRAADAGPALPEAEAGPSALQRSIELRQQLDLVNEQLADQESRYGPFDPRLQEPLLALVNTLVELEDFDEAGAVLERRLQLLRTSNGLTTLEQLPVLSELIINDLRRQDWNAIGDRLEFIDWLHNQDPDATPEVRLQSSRDLALWHFAGVYLDQPTRRVRRFLDARERVRQNIQTARQLYGEQAPEILPWLYQEAVLQYQIAAVLVADDELGVYARDDIALIEGRSVESYLREGLNLLKQIRGIVDTTDDLEAQGMAMTYEADFQMLLDLGTAPRLYREAMARLAEAGLDQAQITRFFQRPVMLPEPTLLLSLQGAIDAQDQTGYRVIAGSGDEQPVFDLGTFIAWSDSLPVARRPELPAAVAALDTMLDYHQLEVSFTLNSRGDTRNPDILASSTDSARVRRDTTLALRRIRFRPYFDEGRWRRVDEVRLRYLVLPDAD